METGYRHALHAKRDDQQVLGIEGPARILTRQSASAAKPLLAQSGRCVRYPACPFSEAKQTREKVRFID